MIAIIIQARINSQRLPGKVLLPLSDRSIIEQVIYRSLKADSPNCVIVATPSNRIAEIATKAGAKTYIGDENDVLGRFYHTANEFDVNTIVRITSDCPCVSPRGIDQMVRFFGEESCDIMCNHSDAIIGLGVDGLDIEVFSFEALKEAHEKATSNYDREHVCPWIYRNLKHQQAAYLWDFPSNVKLSIDTQKDYELVYDIFEKLGNDFETRELVKYFKEN